jgi:hypothetical protein
MPQKPATPNQTPKPVFPAPSFKYGSSTYVVLCYAKMKNKEFGIEDVKGITSRYTSDYEVKRSLDVLVKNGSLSTIGSNMWKITPKGIQQVFDFASRRKSIGFGSSAKPGMSHQ